MQGQYAWRRRGIFAASIAAAAVCANLAVAADTASPPIKVVWQVQELSLTYMGLTSHYSCDAVRDRVADWILQVGAHANSKVTISGCDNPSGPAHMPSVRIVLATPIRADAAGTNANDSKRAAAVAKLQSKGKAPFEDGSFDAVSKTVSIGSKSYSGGTTADGDCELLENFRDSVIKKIDARIVNDNLRCIPHQATAGARQLTVEVLARTAN